MKYFKNAELARLHNVSEKSVRNWIDASQQGKTGLKLYQQDERIYIADTLQNEHVIDQLVARSRKYRNQLSHKTVSPTPDFYATYTTAQIADIVNQLETHHEIPIQYRYVGEGAKHWDAYLTKLYYADKTNILSATVNLLQFMVPYLNSLTEAYQTINVIDLGVGNGLAVRQLLQHLYKSEKLGKYIGVDTSKDLLAITERNIKRWFDGAIDREMHAKDLNYERFTHLLQQHGPSTINLVLFAGGTIGNFRHPTNVLRTIHDSMRPEDILITTTKLDTPPARRFFDFNAVDTHALPQHHRNQLAMLSIDESLYDVEQAYDEQAKHRYIQVRLKYALSLAFQTETFSRTLHFEKGETLLLLRFKHYTSSTITALYEDQGFSQLAMSKTPDEQFALMISRAQQDFAA